MLRPWNIPLSVEISSDRAIYLQIAENVAEEIRRGRLKPGVALPGTRALSKMLKLNRNTVAMAYDELIAAGWATAESSRGTFVSVPHGVTVSNGTEPRGPLLVKAGRQRATEGGRAQERLTFSEEVDTRLPQISEIELLLRRCSRDRYRFAWRARHTQGTPELRGLLAEMLRTCRGMAVEAESLLLTRSHEVSLHLCAMAFAAQGTVVAVEQPGNRRAMELFALTGATVVGLPVDAAGMSLEALRALANGRQVNVIYVTPHAQHPTGVSMPVERRQALLSFAAETGAVVIEDDRDHELDAEGRTSSALAGLDRFGCVVHLSSFSRLLPQRLQISCIAANEERLKRLTQIRGLIDGGGDSALEHSLAELIQCGRWERRAARIAAIYLNRRDLLTTQLRRELGARVDVYPAGAAAVWLRSRDRGLDVKAWASAAAAEGVRIPGSALFAGTREQAPGMRLACSAMNETEIEHAVAILARTVPGALSDRPRLAYRRHQ